jgi:hypothetical protein
MEGGVSSQALQSEGKKYYYCFVNKTREKQKDGKDHV